MKIRFSVLVAVLVAVLAGNMASAENSPREILAAAFANYNLVSSEVEVSLIKSTRWRGASKFCTCWIRRDPGSKKEMMFVLNRVGGLKPQADGAVITSAKGIFRAPVIVQIRKGVRYKESLYDDPSNGTELNYFDLMRLGGESVDSLELSFWDGKPGKLVKYPNEKCSDCEIEFSIKAVPKAKQAGDYAFRVFHVGIIHEMVAVLAVECFGGKDLSLSKVQLNSYFEVIESSSSRVVREKQREFITAQEDFTLISIIPESRQLDAEFGELDEDALKNGQP